MVASNNKYKIPPVLSKTLTDKINHFKQTAYLVTQVIVKIKTLLD